MSTQPGFLYVITHENARGMVKIGITRHPEKRMQQLDNPEVLAMIPCGDARADEQALHDRYRSFRLPQSEWFSLPDETLSELLRKVASIYKEHRSKHLVVPGQAEQQKELGEALKEIEFLKAENRMLKGELEVTRYELNKYRPNLDRFRQSQTAENAGESEIKDDEQSELRKKYGGVMPGYIPRKTPDGKVTWF